ncbi:MAG TPA: hypothetical protein DIW77_02785 [Chromatiaceae bacterium]|nr:MAG: hypothetical protein N838_13760 [Thiohalocapsa sp. PB-PSB1]HCS89001.1 hypothetical protein [Chromatiaceae bacterium]
MNFETPLEAELHLDLCDDKLHATREFDLFGSICSVSGLSRSGSSRVTMPCCICFPDQRLAVF